jgi:hypothetical protein
VGPSGWGRPWLAATAVGGAIAVGVAGYALFLHARPHLMRAGCRAETPRGSLPLDVEQAANSAVIAGVAFRKRLPPAAVIIAYATALQESRLRNPRGGDRDSVGLFQQRPSQGWGTVEDIMDPVYATGQFLDHLVKVDGYEDMTITDAAQAVQRSGFPDAYAQHEPRARGFASALTGYSTASLRCELHDAEPGAGDPDTFVARVKRDFGKVPTKVAAPADGPTTITVDARELGEDETRSAWAVAQWAVATAAELGTTTVAVGDQQWDRESGAWSPSTTTSPAGSVRVTLADDSD